MLSVHGVEQSDRVDVIIMRPKIGGFIVSESSGANVISDHCNRG